MEGTRLGQLIMLTMADMFCGAGGFSHGAERSGQVRVVYGVNHNRRAVETFTANMIHARGINSKIENSHPAECRVRINILAGSPECTRHSNAYGDKPTNDNERAGGWELLKWIEWHRPDWVVFENVPAYRNWGPVGKNGRPLKSGKGKIFDQWIRAIAAHDYSVEFEILNAADYGAWTSRPRLFVIGRRGKRKPVWPEKTHTPETGGRPPGMGLLPYCSVRSVIDWNLPIPTITGRERPLCENTMRRIQVGRATYGDKPFLVLYYGTSTVSSIDAPCPTITTRDRFALVVGDGYRLLTVDELKRIQGFSRDYKFFGTETEIKTQIGNSVSPVQACAVFRAIAAV